MKLAILIGAIWSAAATVTSAQQRVAVNLNTHSRVEINRPAAAIWPHIVDPSSWKQGLKASHRAGRVGQVGQILAAADPANAGAIAYFVENVEVVPNERRTTKIYEPGGRLLGFATWTLVETGGRTVVGYDVYSETVLPADQAAGLSSEAVAELERKEYETNKKRFDAELLGLKRLAEAR